MVTPFVDRLRPLIDLREQVVSFPPQPVITRDNLVVGIDTVIYFQVTDPRAATYEIASYVAATYPATGSFPTQLTAADTAFLQGTLGQFDAANANVSGYGAQTGTNQSDIAAAQARVADRQTAAAAVLGDVADADPAKAATDLQLAQVAVQASAQVFTTLKGSSLLDLLSATA